LWPQREPQLLRLPALDAVQSLQRLGELPVQAGQATAPVLAGWLASCTQGSPQGICPGWGIVLR